MQHVSAGLAAAVAAGALLSGCGDDAPGAAGGDGLLTDPTDFPRDGCVPGSLAGADLAGIYHLRAEWEDGRTFVMAVRIDRLGVRDDGAVAGYDADLVTIDEHDALVHHLADDGRELAADLCALDDDGRVRGWFGLCSETGCGAARLSGRKLVPLAEPAAAGLALLGEHGPWTDGLTVNVRVDGDVAYLARYQDGLRILDVSDPGDIVELGHQPLEYPEAGEIWNDVKLVTAAGRRYALLASNQVGAVVVDVTVASAPRIVAHFGTVPFPGDPTNVHSLFVDGGKAYLASRGIGLEIYDVADPTRPARLGGFTLPGGYLHDLFVAGDRAYLDFWDLGLAIVDVSDPAAPILLGRFADYGETTSHSSWVTEVGDRRIAVHGDEQWGAHVRIVDVTEGRETFATQLGEWQTRPEVSVHNVMAAGSRAFIAHYQDGVRVLDLSDPAAPAEIAHYQTWPGHDRRYGYSFYEGAFGLDLDLGRGRIYVADSHRGLLVLGLE